MARRKGNQLQKTVENILKEKKMNYNDWRKEVIYKRKLAVMADEDKEWLDKTVEEESLNLVMQYLNLIVDDDKEKSAI
ncbi:hypothetical protein B4065_1377 [Caldibacillus thermoamylovorans]|uniref:DUF5415 family protein n=1 Tax=Caldibacillus thermoamylovorans TaxID=35841 RepID=UPI0005A43DA9|nr:hypothetical protein [Caldibacillus thermoamylovorans]KIO69711.1 hypothetical protein B4065_1377 [Caldibacillus thermoamylovorans]